MKLLVSTIVCCLGAVALAQSSVNGKDPNTYYQGLTYKVVNVPGSDRPLYRVLSSDLMAPPKLANGNYVLAELYLMKNGSYVLDYEEAKSSGRGAYSHGAEPQTRITGTWTVNGTQLILSDVGIAAGTQDDTIDVNGKPIKADATTLTFSKDIASPGLKGQSLMFNRALSTWPFTN